MQVQTRVLRHVKRLMTGNRVKEFFRDSCLMTKEMDFVTCHMKLPGVGMCVCVRVCVCVCVCVFVFVCVCSCAWTRQTCQGELHSQVKRSNSLTRTEGKTTCLSEKRMTK